jgi:hypothetical protein
MPLIIRNTGILLLVCWACASYTLGFTYTFTSPGNVCAVTVVQDTSGNPFPGETDLGFMATVGNDTAIRWSPLGIRMTEPLFDGMLRFVSQSTESIDETYPMISGKVAQQRNRCTQETFVFTSVDSLQVKLIMRAYDDGVAYRYVLDNGRKQAAISEDLSGFALPVGSAAWMQEVTKNYEATYECYSVGDSMPFEKYGNFPALFNTPAGSWVLLTEAGTNGTTGAGHYTVSPDSRTLYRIALSQPVITGDLAWVLPWRVAIMGRGLAAIIESNLVEQLNAPSAIADESWILPGRVAWSWWSDDESPKSLEKQKLFVDFAGSMGWEYVLADEGWSSNWISELVQYAGARNTGVLVWYNWIDLDSPAELEERLSRLTAWGVKGIKVDFIDNDGQDRMRFYDSLLVKTAEKKLLVNLHGTTLYRGWRRQWPNLLTVESVRGAEHYKYIDSANGYPSPQQNCILPFTRNVVGPMDYTPVTFSASARTTTAAHELALSVVFESGLQHFADSPQSYSASSGKQFLMDVPAKWDNTRFLAGYPGQYACIARRSNGNWFVAGINAGEARDATFGLSFAKQGSYATVLYDDDTENDLDARHDTIDTRGVITVSMAARGGFCFMLADAYDPLRDSLATKQTGAADASRQPVRVSVIAGGYELHIGAPGEYTVKVLDILGKSLLIKKVQGLETVRIGTKQFAAGVRLLCVTRGAMRYVQRLVN